MKKTNGQKGITLIALIITIVVLLILAVVAIRAVQGDGIIRYAQNARDDYQEAQANENTVLQNYIDKLNGINGSEGSEIWVQDKLTVTKGKTILKVGDVVNYKENDNDKNVYKVLGAQDGNLLLLTTGYNVQYLVDTDSDGIEDDIAAEWPHCSRLRSGLGALSTGSSYGGFVLPRGNGTGAIGSRLIYQEDIERLGTLDASASSMIYTSHDSSYYYTGDSPRRVEVYFDEENNMMYYFYYRFKYGSSESYEEAMGESNVEIQGQFYESEWNASYGDSYYASSDNGDAGFRDVIILSSDVVCTGSSAAGWDIAV